MTVSTTVNKIVQLGDGVTTVFSFPFAVRANGQTDIQVFITVSGVLTQLTFGSQYTVSLNAAIAPNPTPVGGTVTLSVAPANGALVTILRTMALTQPTSLANQGTLYQPVLESMDDNQSMELQQISELQGRAITVAVSDSAPTNLPPAAQRANQALVFDSSGNPTAGVIPATGVISSAMAPFVGAASISAAKALLGYGTMANENIGAVGKGINDDGSGNARVNYTIVPIALSTSPNSSNHFDNFVASGTLIFTLPKLTTVFNGYELWFFCISGTSTLSPNAADNFPSLGGGVSVVLQAGYFARIIGDGVSSWMITRGRIPSINVTTQTRQTFTSGSAATYTTPTACTRIVVRMIAGGGGGTGSTGAGTDGGDSIFNGIHAAGGKKGVQNGKGAGGSAGTGSASLRIPGGSGGFGISSATLNGGGGSGGNGVFGGGASGADGATNTGAGGSSMIGDGANMYGGGGAGEYVELIINNPAATYPYTVGAGGSAGSGAASCFAGAAGLIIVDEFYSAAG